jgi:hypothetical protein
MIFHPFGGVHVCYKEIFILKLRSVHIYYNRVKKSGDFCGEFFLLEIISTPQINFTFFKLSLNHVGRFNLKTIYILKSLHNWMDVQNLIKCNKCRSPNISFCEQSNLSSGLSSDVYMHYLGSIDHQLIS